jgi:hypothetical protein
MALDIFGNLFGGDTTTGINALLNADQRRLMSQQGNLSAAAALLAASGPNRQRQSLGQALGSALQAGQQGYQQARAGSLQELLLGEKLKEAQRLGQYQTALSGAQAPAAAAPAMEPLSPAMASLISQAAPTSTAGPVGPTTQRAAIMDAAQVAPPAPVAPSKADLRFDELMRKADVANQFNRPEDAQKFLDQAYKIKPVEEFSTTPQFGMSPQGTPISFVLSKSGAMRLLDVQRNPEFNYQDTGSFISVRDKNTNRELERIPKTMTPGEVASNAIAQGTLAVAQGNLGVAQGNLAYRGREFERGGFQIKETADGGLTYVPTMPGGLAQPVMGPSGQVRGAGGAPTEGQSNAAGFAQRMELAASIINRLPAGSQPGVGTRLAEAVPFVGGALARSGQSTETQQYTQAAQDWIRAKLRKESGAVIGTQEMQDEFNTYFPQVGDSPERITQKAEARRVATLAMQKSAGRAYQPYVPPAPAAQAAPTTQRNMRWNGTQFVFE